jgi:hypothetical protein
MSYSKPKCEKGSKLIKSRCECKKSKKNKTVKKSQKKSPKKPPKKDKYQEHWALVRGQYSLNLPSDKQLKVRRRRIDEVYELYNNIKKLDKSIPHPKKWHSPPEFCYNEQLQNMIKAMKIELKENKKKIGKTHII